MTYKYARSGDVKNKTVLLRVDMNEELNSRGRLGDDFRIQAIVPTIQWLRKQNAKVVIVSHMGRPDGKASKALSLKPMVKRLAELLEIKFVETDHRLPKYPVNHLVFFTGDVTDKNTQDALQEIPAKDITVLENIRFFKGEEENEAGLAKHLASFADVYINDAFAVSHRKAASIVAITKYLPSFAGPLLEKEIRNLDYVVHKAKKPFVLMMGGIKISDKAKTLEYLGRKADKILVGGGIANLLFATQGLEIGHSKVEMDSKNIAWKIAANFKTKLVMPKDVVVADVKQSKKSTKIKAVYDIHPEETIYDIGPKSIFEFAQILKNARTICWNGPLGFFEKKPFHTGTFSLARIVGSVGKKKTFVVVGGGETVATIRATHQQDYIDHLSTGGGAMLEYMAGKELPGLKVLQK